MPRTHALPGCENCRAGTEGVPEIPDVAAIDQLAGLPVLAAAALPHEAIVDLFESAAADGGAAPPHMVLLITAARSQAPDDPEVSPVVRDERALVEDNFR